MPQAKKRKSAKSAESAPAPVEAKAPAKPTRKGLTPANIAAYLLTTPAQFAGQKDYPDGSAVVLVDRGIKGITKHVVTEEALNSYADYTAESTAE